MSTAIHEMLPEILQGRCMLFMGAGSSAACESPMGGGVTGDGLAKAMVAHLGEDPTEFPTSLAEVSEYLEASLPRHRAELDEFIATRLHDLRPTIAHLLLTMFPWRAIVTTNFNRVIEKGYADARSLGLTDFSCRPILSDEELTGLELDTKEIALLKPHGCISRLGHQNPSLILTYKDYYGSIRKRSTMYERIRELAQSSITLFVGYRLADYNFNNLYYELEATLHGYVPQCYAVLQVPAQKARYMERSYAERRITLLDDKADTFMLSLADAAGLLHGKALDVAAAELARPSVVSKLTTYASTIPAQLAQRLAHATP